jgi:hypothetical protein
VTDYSNRSLGELRQTYLRESSDAMPVAVSYIHAIFFMKKPEHEG